MDVDNVSNGSTEAGLKLIADLWDHIKWCQASLERRESPTGRAIAGRMKCDLSVNEVRNIKEALVFAAHRLAFLELAVKGLRYIECEDAADYSKFVDSKRKIEDMDIEELRTLLR